MDNWTKVDFNKEKGYVAFHDKWGKLRLCYSFPLVRFPSNKTATPQLDWDPSTSTISFALPEVSFPIAIAFGVGLKLPDAKGGFSFAFPSFKFGAKGEVESSDSSSEDEAKKLKGGIPRKTSSADTTGYKVKFLTNLLCYEQLLI